MNREPLRHDRDASRQQISQTQAVSETTKSMQTHMGHHPLTAGLHQQPGSAGSVHLRSALLVGVLYAFDKRSIPCQEGVFADPRPSGHRPG